MVVLVFMVSSERWTRRPSRHHDLDSSSRMCARGRWDPSLARPLCSPCSGSRGCAGWRLDAEASWWSRGGWLAAPSASACQDRRSARSCQRSARSGTRPLLDDHSFIKEKKKHKLNKNTECQIFKIYWDLRDLNKKFPWVFHILKLNEILNENLQLDTTLIEDITIFQFNNFLFRYYLKYSNTMKAIHAKISKKSIQFRPKFCWSSSSNASC